jgi:hypothetical protein
MQSTLLVLRTADLTRGQSTDVGFSDAYGADQTWYNLDMATICGSMWTQYGKFALTLVQIGLGGESASTFGINGPFVQTEIHMQGLSWVDGQFDSKLRMVTQTSSSGCFPLNRSGNPSSYCCSAFHR